MTDAFSMFGFSEEEIQEAKEAMVAKPKAKGVICLCGHPVGRHTELAGRSSCSAGKFTCPCKKVRSVIQVDNARIFLRRTKGAGQFHALAQGMLQAVEDGQEIEWLIDLACDKCGTAEGPIVPVAVSQRGIIMQEATGYDALLCRKCRSEI